MPTRHFGERALERGQDTIELCYFGRAHTDGDTIAVCSWLGTAHVYRLRPWQLQGRVYDELSRPAVPPRRLWRGVVTE